MTSNDDRAADARADVLVFKRKHWIADGGEYVGRFDFAEAGELFVEGNERDDDLNGRVPFYGVRLDNARQFVAALPVERRARFNAALVAVVAPDGSYRAHCWTLDDAELFALLTATPRQLRDAVIAAMEG